MDISKRIIQLLEERGWSEYKLAKNSDLPQPTFTNIFRRKSVPSIATLEKICNGFGITLAEFFAEGEMAELTPDLREVFAHWKSLTDEQKNAVLVMLRVLDQEKKNEE